MKEDKGRERVGKVLAQAVALMKDLTEFLEDEVQKERKRGETVLAALVSGWRWEESRLALYQVVQKVGGKAEKPDDLSLRLSLEDAVQAEFSCLLRDPRGHPPYDFVRVELKGHDWRFEARAKLPMGEKPVLTSGVDFKKESHEDYATGTTKKKSGCPCRTPPSKWRSRSRSS